MTDDPYADAASAGIHRLSIPTPFAVGRVNAFLIDDDPLTLVDSGPNSGTSLEELTQGISALGHSLEDIELLIVTHQHIDHTGLVGLIASRSGAEVAMIDHGVAAVERYSEEAQADDEFAVEVMLRHGIPEEVVTALRAVSRAFRAWGAPAKITRVLRAGDQIELRDRTFEVQWRPGHSPSDTVFEDPERRMLIGGDHLLDHISSNPLIARPAGGSTERPRSLVTYLESLALTREMDLDTILPGHGNPVTDHRGLIDERVMLHRRRADKIHRLITERPLTAHEVALSLWGNVAVTQAYLTISEVIGHTDILLGEGRAREVERDGIVHFEAA